MSAGIINYNQRITISSRSGALAPHLTRREKAPDFGRLQGAALSEPEVLFTPQFPQSETTAGGSDRSPAPPYPRAATPRGRRPGGAASSPPPPPDSPLPPVPAAHVPGHPSPALDSTSSPLALPPQPPSGPAPPPESMAGTRWVLGALLRGCGCNCSSCRRTGAACLPFYSTAGSFPSGVSGRRRLLLLLGAAAAAASQTRGFQSGPVTAGRLAGPPTAAASAAAAAAASYPALRSPLLPQSLAAAAAGPARGYSQVRGCREGPRAGPSPGRAPAPLGVRLAGARGVPRHAPHPPSAPTPARPVLLLGPGTRDAFPGLGFSSCFCSPLESVVGWAV